MSHTRDVSALVHGPVEDMTNEEFEHNISVWEKVFPSLAIHIRGIQFDLVEALGWKRKAELALGSLATAGQLYHRIMALKEQARAGGEGIDNIPYIEVKTGLPEYDPETPEGVNIEGYSSVPVMEADTDGDLRENKNND